MFIEKILLSTSTKKRLSQSGEKPSIRRVFQMRSIANTVLIDYFMKSSIF